MHTWHRQSPAARVLISNKLILAVQVMRGGVVLQSGALMPSWPCISYTGLLSLLIFDAAL